jgi:uncharacterized protein
MRPDLVNPPRAKSRCPAGRPRAVLGVEQHPQCRHPTYPRTRDRHQRWEYGMRDFASLGQRKVVLGMIHLDALPGTPFQNQAGFSATLSRAVESARALSEGGADGCLLQTVERVYRVHDECDPARASCMTLIVDAVARETRADFQIGVQILRNALKASLAVARYAGGSFIRADALVGMTLSEHGMIEANPYDVMEYLNLIDARKIKIIAEVDSPRFKWFGEGRSTAQVSHAARLVGADAVCLGYPDVERTLNMIDAVRHAEPGLPIILAGHTNHENAARLLGAADGAFVGTCLERDGWGGRIDAALVKRYMDVVHKLNGG